MAFWASFSTLPKDDEFEADQKILNCRTESFRKDLAMVHYPVVSLYTSKMTGGENQVSIDDLWHIPVQELDQESVASLLRMFGFYDEGQGGEGMGMLVRDVLATGTLYALPEDENVVYLLYYDTCIPKRGARPEWRFFSFGYCSVGGNGVDLWKSEHLLHPSRVSANTRKCTSFQKYRLEETSSPVFLAVLGYIRGACMASQTEYASAA